MNVDQQVASSPFASKYSDPMAVKVPKYTFTEQRPMTRGNASHGSAPDNNAPGTRGGTRGGRRTKQHPVGFIESGLDGFYPTNQSSQVKFSGPSAGQGMFE